MSHRLRYRGVFDAAAGYQRGDIVKRDGAYVVYGDGWLPVVGQPDPLLDRIPLDGRDGAPGADGKDGRDGRDGADGKRGKRGKDGREGGTMHHVRRTIQGANQDIELAFLEDAAAGTPLYLHNNDKCGVTNSLSKYRLISAIGFAVNDTVGGSRGSVRTAGIISVSQTLIAGGNYLLSGYGELASDPSAVAAAVQMGVAFDEHRLLIRPQVLHITDHVLTANLSAGNKGQVVALVGRDTLALYSRTSDPYRHAVGVLTADASGTATYVGNGTVVQSDWSAVLESGSTLTPNQNYYGSDKPGKLTTESIERVFIGAAESTTKLNVSIGSPPPYKGLEV